MGPLVYYCRWRNAKLRLRGRDDQFIRGELIFIKDDRERAQAFRYDHQTWELWVLEEEGEVRYQLDELGVVLKTNAGDEPQ
ncbi:MAG: hypothetical protein R6X18_10295 [Chloroflexota bacterium]|jgi:hypothetical protein